MWLVSCQTHSPRGRSGSVGRSLKSPEPKCLSRERCTDRRACRGFSGRAPFPSDGPAAVVYLSAFGKGAELVQHPEWVSYVRLTTADYDHEQDEQDDQAGDVVDDAKLEL